MAFMFNFSRHLNAPSPEEQHADRMKLLPQHTMKAIGDALANGMSFRYPATYWKTVTNGREIFHSRAMGHLQAWKGGEKDNPRSGISHLAHAITYLMFLHDVTEGHNDN
jgi:hypothetical protein